MAEKVASPVWRALKELDADVRRELGRVAGALREADARMAGGEGEVWVGPAARAWGGELRGAAGEVTAQANAFAEYVGRQLAARPREVTPGEADTERRILAGRLR